MNRLVLAALVGLAACQGPPPSRGFSNGGSASAADAQACRQRADEVYLKQNRAELYRSDTYATSGRDSPFSIANLPGVTSRGLSGRYERDNLVSDCLNASGSNGAGSPAANSAPSQVGPAFSQ